MKILLLGFLILFTSTTAEKLQCAFYEDVNLQIQKEFYKCDVKNVAIFSGNQVNVEAAEGEHFKGKSNDDVKAIYIRDAPDMNKFPNNLGNIFKNLELIFIIKSKLKVITSDDLKAFPKLKYLVLRDNDIETIREDLFSHNHDLELIHFHKNKISHIDNKAFSGLSKLSTLILLRNVCNVGVGETREDVVTLVKKIEGGACKA